MLFFFGASTHLYCGTCVEAVRATNEFLDRLQAVAILTTHDNISETMLKKRQSALTVSDT